MSQNVLQLFFRYKLNSFALQVLEEKKLPKNFILKLNSYQDTVFHSKAALDSFLNEKIGLQDDGIYKNQIIKAARVFQTSRIIRYLTFLWENNFPPSEIKIPLFSYIGLNSFPLSSKLYLRYWWFHFLNYFKKRKAIHEETNDNLTGHLHNLKQVLSFQKGHRNRTERLINALRNIQGYDFSKSKILCIGPRNEAELFLLNYYGFRLRNIESIDLFTYSPLIKLMDMNNMSFPDNYFDIYYSSFVIRYSPDIHRTISESIRVTRSGGLIVFGFTFGFVSSSIPKGSELLGGIKELLSMYSENVDYVFWQEEYQVSENDRRGSIIFKLKK